MSYSMQDDDPVATERTIQAICDQMGVSPDDRVSDGTFFGMIVDAGLGRISWRHVLRDKVIMARLIRKANGT